MAQLNPLISFDEPFTRQDLFDMWATAAFSEITTEDFADGFNPIVISSSFSGFPTSPDPGQLVWHQEENVMYCYHDVIDDTGVSLWLAIGPDKFETAMLLKGPAAVGTGVELTGPGRTCQVYDSTGTQTDKRHMAPVVVGFNQSHINSQLRPDYDDESVPGDWIYFNTSGDDSGATYFMGETAVSGEWIRVAIDGLMYMASAPGSAITLGLSTWTDGPGTVGMSLEFPGTVNDSNDSEAPFNLFIGVQPFWNLREGSLTRTEPWWLTKIAFCPRYSRKNQFNT